MGRLEAGHIHQEELALKGNTCQIYTTSFLGDGTNNREVTGFGFDPKYVICISDYGATWHIHPVSDTFTAWDTFYYDSAGDDNNAIRIITDGIEVNNGHASDQCNANGITYHVVAWG